MTEKEREPPFVYFVDGLDEYPFMNEEDRKELFDILRRDLFYRN